MERPRRASSRSKSASKAPNAVVVARRRGLGQENLHNRRRLKAVEIRSDSSSCNSYSPEEDSLPRKVKLRSKQTSEVPIKKLLAEELSKVMEPRRRSPSLIGRLMGLDTMPSQPSIKRQEKKCSENYIKKKETLSYLDKRLSYENQLRSVRNKEQQEFKDVFEVLESSMPKKHPDYFNREGMNSSNLSETKMDLVRQKFMDVKRLSGHEKLQQSKEFDDALEVLDSNKDLLLKFLQQPNSVFTKHLHELHGVQSSPDSGHLTVLRSKNAQGNRYKKPDGNTEQNDRARPFQKHDQGAISRSRRKNVYIPSEVPKFQVQEKDTTRQFPTRIVVLKPNLKKVQNTMTPVSLLDSSRDLPSGRGKNTEFGSSESFKVHKEVRCRRDSSEFEHMKHTTHGSREIAKEITRQMRQSVTSGSRMARNVEGYAGDESSYSLSGTDSANESERNMPTSRHLSDLESRYRPSSSYSTDSSVSREAKKRISERWKMAHGFEKSGKVSRGSTLGEMLAMPDEVRLSAFDHTVSSDGSSSKLSMKGRVTRCGSPLGISSRDGWKDEGIRTLSRSKSLPASSTCVDNPKTSIKDRSLRKDKRSVPKDSLNLGLNNSRKVNRDKKDELFLKSNIKVGPKRPHYNFCVDGKNDQPTRDFDLNLDAQKHVDGDGSCHVQDANLKPDEIKECFEVVGLSEWKPNTPDIHISGLMKTITSVNNPELSADGLNPENTSIGNTGGCSMFSHCTITEVESPASSKGAGQPSPDSVLEPFFLEESSPSPDCFEKISAGLHGLRMQLQLLKSETSDAYSEGSEMIVSSDEDTKEESRDFPGLVRMIDRDREYSYVVDVLIVAGFHDVDLSVLLETCYCPELPVAPYSFDDLEKKYADQILWSRSDRKLLFDGINYGLSELLQPLLNPNQWTKRSIGTQRKKERVIDELWNLLGGHREIEMDSWLEKAMEEMKWSDSGDTNVIVTEIENLLSEELVAEAIGGLVVG